MKHKCPLCPKEYQSYNDLQTHVKKIHGKSDIEQNFEGYRKIILGDCVKEVKK